MEGELKAKVTALAAAIKETDIYKAWRKAREDLAEHHAAQVMLRDLRAVEAELVRKAQAGEEITQAEQERYQRSMETVAYNPYVRAVLETDLALAQLLVAVQQAIVQELGLDAEEAGLAAGAPGGPGGPGLAAPPPPPEPPRKSRLWVPGQP
ncbi:MAG TPA: YlbF family regulator [Limnochordales bacterium]